MKITLCQHNNLIGNIEENTKKIIKSIEKSKSENSDLIVFPELAICGYPPNDLFFNSSFTKKAIDGIQKIASHCVGITAIVGGVDINNSYGKKLFNAAFILQNGKIAEIYHKALLPTYDVFDEARYFEPDYKPLVFELKGLKIGVTISEDLWTSEVDIYPTLGKPKYLYDIIAAYKKLEPDFMVNIAASPYSTSHQKYRYELLQRVQKKLNCPLYYLNQVGANTDLVFDGGSVIIKSDKNKFYLPFFAEKEITIEHNSFISNNLLMTEIESLYSALILGIKEFFSKNGFKKAVLGLSGGIDSAVVAVLASHALGNENIHCVLMPSRYSSQHSINDAIELCKKNNIKYDILPIEKTFNVFENTLSKIFKDKQPDITEENLQARIRAVYLMAYSNKFSYILLNTSNKSEIAVGYGTLYGDMCGALSVIGDVYKTQVYQLAHYLNREKELIPVNIIQKPPSAELKPNQKDTDTLPEYNLLDSLLYYIIEMQMTIPDLIQKGYNEEVVKKVYNLVQKNEYKRYQAPPVIRVSTKAFGYGRRMPLVKRF